MEPEKSENKQRTLEDMNASMDKLAERLYGKKIPATPQEIEYVAQIEERAKKAKDTTISGLIGSYKQRTVFFDKTPYPISNKDAKELFWFIYRTELGRDNKTPFLDGNYKEVLAELTKYFVGDISSKLDTNKGIYLWGDVGAGKSALMTSFSIMLGVLDKKFKEAGKSFTSRNFQIFHAKLMVMEVAQKKSVDVLKNYTKSPICIDDIGQEEPYKLFGNDTDVIEEVITERYMYRQSRDLVTHATSNLSPVNWLSRYDKRIDSRFHDMFNIVELVGADKRKI